MFREMRRKEKQLSREEAFDILNEGDYGVLGTIGNNGYPYTVPLNYVFVFENIYFHSAMKGHKIDNIKYNNKASFTVVNKSKVIEDKFTTDYKSIIIFGKISMVYGEEKRKSLMELINKYSPDFKKEGIRYIENYLDEVIVFKLNIDNITAKGNKD
jgi:uncharacterized protein